MNSSDIVNKTPGEPRKTLFFNKRSKAEIPEYLLVEIQEIAKETKCKIHSSPLPDDWLCMVVGNNYLSSKELKKNKWWKP